MDLRTRSWSEAIEILRRIRVSNDPLAVVRHVRDGDLLLYGAEDGIGDSAPGDRPTPDMTEAQPVPCPWTSLANDNAVHDLINIFFQKDQSFLMSFIDKHAFLSDLHAGPECLGSRSFCSALLVNAICAMTMVTCTIETKTFCIADGGI